MVYLNAWRRIGIITSGEPPQWEIQTSYLLEFSPQETSFVIPEIKVPYGWGYVIFTAEEISLRATHSGPWVIINMHPSLAVLIAPFGTEVPVYLTWKISEENGKRILFCKVLFNETHIFITEEGSP